VAEKLNLFSMSKKGKVFKIFWSESYKEHERDTMAQMFWRYKWCIAVFLFCVVGFYMSFPLEHVWRYGWGPATAKWMGVYFSHLFTSWGTAPFAEIPAWVMRAVTQPDMPAMSPLFPIVAYFIMTDDTLLKEFNPYGKDSLKERSSRKANLKDIEKMGLFRGFCQVLGYVKKKPLMMPETFSTLCVAPPGTGKSQGVVFPTIFDSREMSMIINDPKPELKQKSSGFRATIGPVFIMNWAGQDDPANGVYYPSWNPLSPGHIPYNQEDRDMYVDSIVSILIPEKTASSADPHWTITGRAALSGMIQFIVSKVDKAKADDYFYSRLDAGTFDAEDAVLLDEYYTAMNDMNAMAARSLLASGGLNKMNYVHVGTWRNLPPSWVGREASLAMILDWMNEAQIKMTEAEEEKRKSGDSMAAMMSDSMRDLLNDADTEARQYGYAHRASLELKQLAGVPDKERGSILSTALSGLSIFKNAAVRNRTSHSDFHFEDLRGMRDPRDDKWKPVSVYLSINQVDADALNPITGIFIELMSRFLLANLPSEKHAGRELGPYPVLFVLDEMPKMQKLQAVIQGPDLGRGCKVSYLIIGQDLHQIAEKYGNDAMATIMSTTAAKIVLRQNDVDSAKKFSEMMGEKITEEVKKDKDGKETKTPQQEPLFSEMDIRKLAYDKQLVIYQGWAHRPIEADKQDAWKDPRLVGYMKMGESAPLPDFLVPAHHKTMGYPGVPKIKSADGRIIDMPAEIFELAKKAANG
jgi:type IV secretory pathway TraG/TraD family ATPase VirD4